MAQKSKAQMELDETNDRTNEIILSATAGADGVFRTAYDQLKPTEREFVDAYMITDDPRGAMLRVYPQYKGHGVLGGVRAREYVQRPLVVAAIAERMREVAERSMMTAEQVIAEVVKIAKSNMNDYGAVDDDGFFIPDLTNVSREQMAAVSEVRVEQYTEGRGKDAKQVKRFTFKLHDKLNALEKMMKYYGLNAPTQVDLRTQQIAGPTKDIPVDMTAEQAAALYASTLAGDD